MGRAVGAGPTQYTRVSKELVALTHARAAPCTHVESVASVAVTIVGATSVHADAFPRAAGLCLTLVHIWKDQQTRRHQRRVVSLGVALRLLPSQPLSTHPCSPTQ